MHDEDPPSQRPLRERWLIEIERWDWNLGLTMAWPSMPEEAKLHGELVYTQGIDIHAKLVAPKLHAGKAIRVWLSASPLHNWSGPDALANLGEFYAYDEPRNGSDFGASIKIPQDSLSNVLTCLSSIWRYIHIWTLEDGDRAFVVGASFARDYHRNLEPWVRGKGEADF